MEGNWTNPSVLRLARDSDPVQVISDRARALARRAMDLGWNGPPYDPLALADLLDLPLSATEEVRDAVTRADTDGRLRIEYNPGRPRARVRFSIAHEIGHTLFPDCAERVRHRAAYHELTGDDWQLEVLCNIAASELLMPVGSLSERDLGALSIEHLVALRSRYEVSMEALLNRQVRIAQEAVAMFAASSPAGDDEAPQYRVEYVIGSPAWRAPPGRGDLLQSRSVSSCTAIGLTAAGDERWPTLTDPVHIECVAVQPHPGARLPRVVGFIRSTNERDDGHLQRRLQEVPGDALDPRRAGPVVIAHIVNDRAMRWGGRGFASALASRYPLAQSDFVQWVLEDRERFRLGATHVSRLSQRLSVVHMVAQAGYGPSRLPRIRYEALELCLEQLAQIALELGASIHMPRIGTGAAGGRWDVIAEMIDASLSQSGVSVFVYSIEGAVAFVRPHQEELGIGASRLP